MNSGLSNDIFLSYSRRDLATVERFRQNLEVGGYLVWFDKKKIRTGENWVGALAEGIGAAQSLIWMVSNESAASAVVRKEVAYAIKKEKPVYLVYLEPYETVALPSDLEFQLGFAHSEILDQVTAEIPPNLIETMAENHQLRPNAFLDAQLRKPEQHLSVDQRLGEFAKLIDRTHHQNEFQEKLFFSKSEGGPIKPVIVVIHGPNNQSVPGFRESLTDYHLPRFRKSGTINASYDIDSDVKIRTIERLDLKKTESHHFDNLLCFALLGRPGNRDQILQFLTDDYEENVRIKAVTFRLFVKNDVSRAAAKFIAGFFDYWSQFPAVKRIMMIVKLEISYPVMKPKIVPFLEKKLPNLASRCDRCILPGLDNIDEGEAGAWLNNNDVKSFLTKEMGFADDSTILQHIRQIYKEAGRDELPMEELEPSIKKRLRDAFQDAKTIH